ncbi:MAG: SpoIID/LytB domain-containing protein [Thermotogae bacterium]|nr:SpoIID/LytB domain-containing protein [Thermotogota bacterium]
MKLKVGLPTYDEFVAEGRITYPGGRAESLRIRSRSGRSISSSWAVFKPSPLGKPFGRFHVERWEMVGLYPDITEAITVAGRVGGTYRIWVEGWGGPMEVVADGKRMVVESPFTFSGRIRTETWVGRGFHWERKEVALYEGTFHAHAWGDGVKVVLETDVERYVAAVAASEMHPNAPAEALKAQAVAARTNLVRTAGKHHPNEPYDICAEDHCQVFRGFHILDENIVRTVGETAGWVLTYGGEPIEARYSKSCGGITETFSVVWGEVDRPYSPSFRDWSVDEGYDASTEEGFRQFYAVEDSFCNVSFPPIENLYRWEVSYTHDEMARMLEPLGVGKVLALVAEGRGRSGRIHTLRVVGDRCERTVKGEYAIRELLGKPFLPSSAFIVDNDGERFILRGMGWGHGVGMCQMGAIGMALGGHDYRSILRHYYRGASMERMWHR